MLGREVLGRGSSGEGCVFRHQKVLGRLRDGGEGDGDRTLGCGHAAAMKSDGCLGYSALELE